LGEDSRKINSIIRFQTIALNDQAPYLLDTQSKINVALYENDKKPGNMPLGIPFFRGSDGVIMVYDTNDADSVSSVVENYWPLVIKYIPDSNKMILGNEIGGRDTKVTQVNIFNTGRM
jgi:hypothetical protein